MQLRKIDRRLFTILLIVFVQMVGASMVLPILPLYAKREFSLEPQVITLLITAFFAAQFIAGPFIGRLSDRYGRVPVLVISQIGTVISFVMIALATSFEMLLFARLLDGITGGNIIVAQAYITDITPEERRTEALGMIFAVFGLGFIFGPGVGGVLSAAFGSRIPFLVAAIAATLTTLITWFTLTETRTPEQRHVTKDQRQPGLTPSGVLTNYPLLFILIIAFFGQFGFGMLQSTFALYSEAILFRGATEAISNLGIGFLLATIGLAQFFTQVFLLRRMLDRYGDAKLVVIGVIIRGISTLLFAIITSVWLAFPSGILFAIGSGLMMPPLQSLATRTVNDDVRGGVLGLYQSSISLSTIFSTALGGFLFAIHPTTPYWIGALLFLLVMIPALYLVRQSGSRKAKVAPTA